MPDEGNRSLIHQSGSALIKQTPGADRILKAMVNESISLVRQQRDTLQACRSRIGNHELCEPDYRQIVLWADALEIAPETVLERLLDNNPVQSAQGIEMTFEEILLRDNKTVIKNGKIVSLLWRFALLPLRTFDWVEGLEIEILRLSDLKCIDPYELALDLNLPQLRELVINPVASFSKVKITKIELSGVPELERLSGTGFAEMDSLASHRPENTGEPPLSRRRLSH